ncbi:sulfotransferase family 2 domain-containing protein [Gloeocapsopsis dulcis]|uniref:Sulfotransferase family protein n=1 Tax=Gloeocapsopsis dulcis AAB1 = 1H9 TaxID=1433147 RepID=A0A6N8G2Y4_9CHRO|nr:sulfotransferase family 2 domain-containing protein [Gloeocapsopsis dulcis]MUL39304.1 hypothetical protein [Gloeocapsopsis dulcis AAB1 = 1H9]WNN87939.1 sulfotransferase family 2 domain-containing protein [Gloeocapsopsis dulcis]
MASLNQDSNQEKSIIFLHIPKASGSTLHNIIERQYSSKVIYSIDGLNVIDSTNKFKNLPEEQRQRIKVLKGHMSFGLHEYLPQPSTYITMLRDPVDRVISHYYYVIRNPQHRLHKQVKDNKITLQEYVSNGITTEVNNSQTRILAAVNKSKVGFDEITGKALEKAKQNLETHFSVIGITEKFDETLILLKKIFDWKTPFYVRENVTKNRQPKENIPQETLEIIQRYNQLDIQLYQYAQHQLKQQISQYSGNFERELTAFKLMNQQYGNIYPLYRSVMRKFKTFTSK